jgi:hypothetical protein
MTHIRPHLMAAFAAAGIVMALPFTAAPALAQASGCEDGKKIIAERHSLAQQIEKLSGGGKKKQIDPRSACTIFTKLTANGEAGVKWMSANKDWCQIPDQVVQGFTEEHKRIQNIKGQACQAAAKLAEMEKRAKQAQQQQQKQGGGNRLGGGLTGTYSIPKGAL